MKNVIFIILALFVSSCASSHNGTVPWSKLLTDPTEQNFQYAQTMISKDSYCNSEWYSKRETNEYRSALFKMISQGNKYAFRTGLLMLDCLDGGELGDAYRSMGVFFDKNPAYFLKVIDEEMTSDVHLKNILTMLPLDTVDNSIKQASMIEHRIQILSDFEGRIDDILYSKLRSALMEAWGDYKNRIAEEIE